MTLIETSLKELEEQIRADERERLANEFIERGDIGVNIAEMSVVAWLLKSGGGGGRYRRITREAYLAGRVDHTGRTVIHRCAKSWTTKVNGETQVMLCHQLESHMLHAKDNLSLFAHPFEKESN